MRKAIGRAERGCHQPQRSRKQLGLGRFQAASTIVAAAAEDSRAPSAARPLAYIVLGLLPLLLIAQAVLGVEMTREYSVQVSAAVQAAPPRLTLSWPQDQCLVPSSYTVYRKTPGATSWGKGTLLPGTATKYTDKQVAVGAAYEYQVVKATSQYTGYGYLCSGINVPMTDSRGKLLLVVDSTFSVSLVGELAQLQQDLVGDGWTVIRLDVGRNDSVVSVKRQLKAQYAADPANVKAVFLLGHVPVPYSGDIVPDGHAPDHQGAWPCDGYYGDMEGVWTDTTVNDTSGQFARNHNVAGDGKFDQSTFPGPIQLMVGRVDLANMPGARWVGGPPTFPNEVELLRNYLDKDHKFRTKQLDLPRRGVIGDFFGRRDGEAFAASGWRNFAALVGPSHVSVVAEQGTWTPTLASNSCLVAYGTGPGSFVTLSGLGNSDSYHDVTTRELHANDPRAAFIFVFGSWLGDWDAEDNIMRSILALPTYGLATGWSGRPHWFLQHMGLGEPVGFSARLTQNNGPDGLYRSERNSCAGQIHIALMGDPTLRLHTVAPPGALVAATNGGSVTLDWAAANDSAVVGYHVYRADACGHFTRLTPAPIAAPSYTDSASANAGNYMVRTVKLETSPSGTYYNPSQGAFLIPAGVTTASPAANTIAFSATGRAMTSLDTNATVHTQTQ